MRRTLAVALMSVMLGAVIAQTAHAQQYPPVGPWFRVSETVVRPGQEVTLSGGGAESGAPVQIMMASAEPKHMATWQTDTKGEFRHGMRIPVDTTPGKHVLSAESGGIVLGTVTLTVVEEPLPFTGRNTLVALSVGLGLVALGVVLLVVARRRRALIG